MTIDQMVGNVLDILSPYDKRFESCPFCGDRNIHHESIGGCRYARCQKCSASGGYIFDFEPAPFSRDEVVKRWNTRVIKVIIEKEE